MYLFRKKTITLLNRDLPLFISLTIGICALLFLLANSVPDKSPEWFGFWGYYESIDIYGGSYRGLITSTFLHINFLHAAFNMYWIWYLGRSLEQHLGTVNMLLFWIMAAFVSSGIQLALSDETGIGASGVLYAIFGYQFISRKYVDRFDQVLDPKIIRLLIIWLFASVVLTRTGILNIGNGAHFSGFGFGCLCGWLIEAKEKKRACFIFSTAVILLVLCSLAYAPWSEAWTYSKGSDTFIHSNFQKAISWYERIPSDSGYYPYALFWKGFAKDSSGNPAGATVDLEQLLKLGKDAYSRQIVLNYLAWIYATSPDPEIRDHPKALRYASEAYDKSQGKEPAYIDTLAAAHAANGDFAKAVEFQEKAIRLSIDRGEKEHLEAFKSRLDLFRNQRHYIEK